MDQVKHVILVLSGKGGVGKSSVTTQLALSLSLQGSSVGVLDIDLTGPSIPRFLGVEDAKVKQSPGGWLPVPVYVPEVKRSAGDDSLGTRAEERSEGDKNTVRANEGNNYKKSVVPGPLYCMSLGFLLKSRGDAVVWRGPKKTAMVRQFLSDVQWGPLSYLLIDTPPGTSDEHISLLETLLKMTNATVSNDSAAAAAAAADRSTQLAGAVLVTTPQAISTADVKKELNFCAKTGLRVLGVVENMAGFVCPSCAECTNVFSKGGGEAMSKEFGVRFLGSVPIDPAFVGLIEEGVVPTYPGGTGMRVNGTTVNVGSDLQDKSTADEKGDTAARPEADTQALTSDYSSDGVGAGRTTGSDLDNTLIGKYTKCSLYPIFHDFTRTITSMVDKET